MFPGALRPFSPKGALCGKTDCARRDFEPCRALAWKEGNGVRGSTQVPTSWVKVGKTPSLSQQEFPSCEKIERALRTACQKAHVPACTLEAHSQ